MHSSVSKSDIHEPSKGSSLHPGNVSFLTCLLHFVYCAPLKNVPVLESAGISGTEPVQ